MEKLTIFKDQNDTEIRKNRLTPNQTREAFANKQDGRTICAFQTRNPPHVAHEMLQKTSITTRDGVFVNPVLLERKNLVTL